ncbi:hypothetical protein [Mucilaginibacter pocheonensis]|uniref:Uncharacterized protein n=1 Tax=Mucilaginibacter pocheonensis TaxID=398050 RepID=A0ABU1T726_9SPHI|nr:hypothetical protein [Mucilaginibacter pocheonensis]MDR6941098.1 hypothetical protein [Mucilaginibacter pocheonensis]
MTLENNEFYDDDKDQQEQTSNKPNAYRVDDDSDLTEEDLQHGYPTSKDDMKKQDAPGMESRGMGGQSFGSNNITPSGDDKANPSQTAGYTNEYFRRTQPAEEHPENSNFTDPNQAGQSNYGQVMDATTQTGQSDEQPESNNEENTPAQRPNPQEPYREGTADDDGNSDKKQVNIPGPNETPDQQKVGE